MSEQDATASPAVDETVPAADPTPAVEVKTDVKPETTEATSSPAGAETPSIFDAVKASLEKTDAKEAPPASEPAKTDSEKAADPSKEEATEEDEEAVDKGELSEDEKKVLSAKTQRRIQKLARQRDAEQEVANRTRNLDAFMQTNGIAPEDAKGAFEILALMRSKPEEALTRIGKLHYELAISLGKVLPQDLREKVEKGAIDEDTARELAVSRAKSQGFERATETYAAESRAAQERDFKAGIDREVNTWEASVLKRDPDFASKRPDVLTHFRALLQTGEKITSPTDARRLMQKALDAVNERWKAIRPAQRAEVRHTPATHSNAAPGEPKSMEDAIRRRLGTAA